MFLQMFAIGLFICAVRKSDDDATGVCFADELLYCLSWGGSVVAAIICPDLRGGRSGIDRLVAFMTAFVPLYAATLFCSGNAASAGSFYQLAFGLMYLLELGMKFIFLPGFMCLCCFF